MRHKKGKTPQAATVLIGEVAESLPIGKWFTVDGFSTMTGIKRRSSQQRVNCLVDDGYLEREHTEQVRGNRFRMSAVSKRLMIERGLKNNSNKFMQKSVKNAEDERRSIEVAITEAYKENAERILKASGFM